MLLEVEHRLQNSCHISILHCKKLKTQKTNKNCQKNFLPKHFLTTGLLSHFFFFSSSTFFFHLKSNFLHKETYFAINE